ncbi:MAG TPA: lipoyl(octanoyl) transferase LipB [Candidatus Acidoferrum sp.]|nr:lipoyl(octanoyl) transferase LipB [Candidatus Acidoferrum sp.]
MDSPALDTAPRPIDRPETGPLTAAWLGRADYRSVWALQKQLAAARAAGSIGDRLLLVEHPAVLTLGRQADEAHVRATAVQLAARGIELIRVERGGEVTYHGPGQLVGYPIIALARRGLLVRPLVRALEAAMIDTCAAFGVTAERREGHPGCWIEPNGARPRKIGALGIRIERGVSYHGIALNLDPDLADFDLIDPCGMPGVVSTSIAAESGRIGDRRSTEAVGNAAAVFAVAFAQRIGVVLDGFGSRSGDRGLAGPEWTDAAEGGSERSGTLATVG